MSTQLSHSDFRATAPSGKRPVRVLHVLGCLGRGGIEIWLMNVLRAIDRDRVRFDFVVDTSEPGPFDDEVRKLGGEIYALDPPQKRLWSFRRRAVQFLEQRGPFDVVHSHVSTYGGAILRAAAFAGVNQRIAHSHTTDPITRRKTIVRRGFSRFMHIWLKRYATAGLACSPSAACTLFGKNWEADRHCQVLPYGFDFSRFSALPPADRLRAQLGIPPQRRVLGQVARLSVEKNHQFTIRVLECLVARGLDVHLLLVGKGETEPAIRELLHEKRLTDRATLSGDQADIAPFMGAMDCKLFPSLFEGFGIVALEAQAAGVPVVASDRVPDQVAVVPGMVERLPLEAGPGVWADAVARRLADPPWDATESYRQIAESEFGIERCVERLCQVYRSHD